MLVVTVGLVVAGIVLLVIGFADSSLVYLYAAVGCAAVAGLVLIVVGRLSRRRNLRLSATASSSIGEGPGASRASMSAADSTATSAAGRVAGSPGPSPAPPDDDGEPEELEGWDQEDWDDEPVFPIEGYDAMRVAEVLPLLRDLGSEELLEVREREMSTKSRATVLRRIDAALAELGGEAPAVEDPVVPERQSPAK